MAKKSLRAAKNNEKQKEMHQSILFTRLVSPKLVYAWKYEYSSTTYTMR